MPVPFLEAGEDQCRRPLWGDDEVTGDVCGERTSPGETYCPACRSRLYTGLAGAPRAPRDGFKATPERESEPDLVEVFG